MTDHNLAKEAALLGAEKAYLEWAAKDLRGQLEQLLGLTDEQMLKESLQALLSKTRVEIGGPFDMVLRALGLESDSQPAGTHKKMWEADALPLTRKAAEELHRHAINHGLRPSVLGRLGLPMEKLLRSERAVSIARGALRMARGVDSGSFASLDPAQGKAPHESVDGALATVVAALGVFSPAVVFDIEELNERLKDNPMPAGFEQLFDEVVLDQQPPDSGGSGSPAAAPTVNPWSDFADPTRVLCLDRAWHHLVRDANSSTGGTEESLLRLQYYVSIVEALATRNPKLTVAVVLCSAGGFQELDLYIKDRRPLLYTLDGVSLGIGAQRAYGALWPTLRLPPRPTSGRYKGAESACHAPLVHPVVGIRGGGMGLLHPKKAQRGGDAPSWTVTYVRCKGSDFPQWTGVEAAQASKVVSNSHRTFILSGAAHSRLISNFYAEKKKSAASQAAQSGKSAGGGDGQSDSDDGSDKGVVEDSDDEEGEAAAAAEQEDPGTRRWLLPAWKKAMAGAAAQGPGHLPLQELFTEEEWVKNVSPMWCYLAQLGDDIRGETDWSADKLQAAGLTDESEALWLSLHLATPQYLVVLELPRDPTRTTELRYKDRNGQAVDLRLQVQQADDADPTQTVTRPWGERVVAEGQAVAWNPSKCHPRRLMLYDVDTRKEERLFRDSDDIRKRTTLVVIYDDQIEPDGRLHPIFSSRNKFHPPPGGSGGYSSGGPWTGYWMSCGDGPGDRPQWVCARVLQAACGMAVCPLSVRAEGVVQPRPKDAELIDEAILYGRLMEQRTRQAGFSSIPVCRERPGMGDYDAWIANKDDIAVPLRQFFLSVQRVKDGRGGSEETLLDEEITAATAMGTGGHQRFWHDPYQTTTRDRSREQGCRIGGGKSMIDAEVVVEDGSAWRVFTTTDGVRATIKGANNVSLEEAEKAMIKWCGDQHVPVPWRQEPPTQPMPLYQHPDDVSSTDYGKLLGVHWHGISSTWQAYVVCAPRKAAQEPTRTVRFGFFTHPIEAALARDVAVSIFQKKFTRNFPESVVQTYTVQHIDSVEERRKVEGQRKPQPYNVEEQRSSTTQGKKRTRNSEEGGS